MNKTSKWNFDKKLLEEGVSIGEKSLSDDNTPMSEKVGIEQDLEFFYNMLSGNFSNESDDLYYCEDLDFEEEKELSFKELKDEIIAKCIEYYCMLGSRAINLIIKIAEEEIFYIPDKFPIQTLTMDEQVEYTIKNYEKHEKDFLSKAKELLLIEKPRLIQMSKDEDISSYVHYSSVLEEPFIIVNPNERTSILNHEIEHAIELSKKIDNADNNIYCEVGSIYFELLFCDLLYEKGILKYSSDFQERVGDTANTIADLYPIFKFIKEIYKKGNSLSDDEFLKLCQDHLEINNLEVLQDFSDIRLTPEYIDEQIRYVFSHLKAIELREQTIRTKRSSKELLIESFKKPLTYRNPDEKVKIYQRYLNEIERKR